MKKILLHICCGVCAFSCIERLKEEGFYIEGLFFNPNIHPHQEYLQRRQVLKIVQDVARIHIIEADYDPNRWLVLCKDYSDEKEGGSRCHICYELRLKETFNLCRELEFDYFTTTLSVSPHKRSNVIFDIGRRVGGTSFLEKDFKKKEGFKRAQELARKYGVYHQNYCGCIYSMIEDKTK